MSDNIKEVQASGERAASQEELDAVKFYYRMLEEQGRIPPGADNYAINVGDAMKAYEKHLASEAAKPRDVIVVGADLKVGDGNKYIGADPKTGRAQSTQKASAHEIAAAEWYAKTRSEKGELPKVKPGQTLAIPVDKAVKAYEKHLAEQKDAPKPIGKIHGDKILKGLNADAQVATIGVVNLGKDLNTLPVLPDAQKPTSVLKPEAEYEVYALKDNDGYIQQYQFKDASGQIVAVYVGDMTWDLQFGLNKKAQDSAAPSSPSTGPQLGLVSPLPTPIA